MAVLNKRTIVSAIEMFGRSSIRLPKVLGDSFSTTIRNLFANNDQGFWYDPSDLSTMFQDAAAGTVPVTGAGQPVGLILDKSGRNNHAYQTTSASRPILRQNAITGAYYLEFDGSDDFLVTNSIDFTATDKVSLFAGVRKLSDAYVGAIAEFSVNTNNNVGSFWLISPLSANANSVSFASRGSATTVASIGLLSAPVSAVLRGVGDISGDNASVYVNANLGDKRVTDQGTGNYGNYPLYIGRRAGTTLPFNGHIYSLIGVGRLTTNDETIAIEKELAKRTGVTLSV